MAPIDLKLGQNAFQVIPELSLFDVENRNIFGFVMCLGPRHMCPGQDEIIETEKSETFWVFDIKK